ncbi:glycine-rich cell wall structural protein-like [Solanum dulcamara]|uniref:glycine-rich cell wall structural protein-like n=1 Tax=Solanum dulcamara TaxID=45834 RepID=UPI0024868631|nr:glycine-rich cell wall structural protein-like [Solanum dulcamara]
MGHGHYLSLRNKPCDETIDGGGAGGGGDGDGALTGGGIGCLAGDGDGPITGGGVGCLAGGGGGCFAGEGDGALTGGGGEGGDLISDSDKCDDGVGLVIDGMPGNTGGIIGSIIGPTRKGGIKAESVDGSGGGDGDGDGGGEIVKCGDI